MNEIADARRRGPIRQAISGVDAALWDAIARRRGRPLVELLAARVTHRWLHMAPVSDRRKSSRRLSAAPRWACGL